MNGHGHTEKKLERDHAEVNGEDSKEVPLANAEIETKSTNEGRDKQKNNKDKDAADDTDKKDKKAKAIVRYDE